MTRPSFTSQFLAMPNAKLESVRASSRSVQYETGGMTNTYTPDRCWVDGYKWANETHH